MVSIGSAIVLLVAFWLLYRVDEWRWRRRLFAEKFAPMLAKEAAEDAACEADQVRRETLRTHWSAKDSGWGWKSECGRTATRPEQPWNFRRRWQGLAHSSARPSLEQQNADLAALLAERLVRLG